MKKESISNYRAEVFHSKLLGDLNVLLDSEGDLWFRLPDLITLLDMDRTAGRRIELEDRKVIKETGRRGAGTTYVNEPGMYTLVLASRKEKALDVKRWITRDVLPSIRKYGGYVQNMENIPKGERDSLAEEIQRLTDEVSRKTDELGKALAGKAKLEKLLTEEEDRVFAKTEKNSKLQAEVNAQAERISELLAEVNRLESFTIGMMSSLSSVSFTEMYLQELKAKKAYESTLNEPKKAKNTETVTQKRDPYVKPVPEDPDPIVRDHFGNIGRRSELLARDFK